MKKILQTTLFGVLVVLSSSASASVSPKSIIKNGTRLIYDVNYYGANYEFTITVREHSGMLEFEWEKTAPDNNKGFVQLSNNARNNATGLFNFTASGTVNLDTRCCVVLSRKMFDAFKNDIPLAIYNDKKSNVLSAFGNAYNHTQTFGYNNDFSNEFDCRTVSNKDDYQITYVDDPDFPLIVEMYIGWSMKLVSISN